MESHHCDERQVVQMTTALNRMRFKRPRSVARSVSVLFALLFLLLRPVCDAFAASDEGHAAMAAQAGHVQAFGSTEGGHAVGEICCSSIDGHALTVPAIPPLPAAFAQTLAAPFIAIRQNFIFVATPLHFTARRDPAPPLPYHARSLRRLD